MWFISAYEYNDNYSQEFDDFLANPAKWDDMLEIKEAGDHPSAIEARVHGNPLLDACSIGWQDSADSMHDQFDVYRAEDEVRAAGGAPTSGYGWKEMFETLPGVWGYFEGFHIIGVDEPEYLEHTEAEIHQRLTTYLAEPFLEPGESWEPDLKNYIPRYIKRQFLNGVSNGRVTLPGAFMEPVRQLLGLPYEWHGAPID